MVCDVIDFKCVIVNELVGSATLTIVIAFIIVMILASRLQFRFRTSIFLGIASMLILSTVLGSFSGILAVVTILVGMFIAWVFQKIIKN